MNQDYGNSLHSCQLLQKKNKALANEVDSHQPHVNTVLAIGYDIIAEGHPQAGEFRQRMNEVEDLWQELLAAIENRRSHLDLSETGHQVCALFSLIIFRNNNKKAVAVFISAKT